LIWAVAEQRETGLLMLRSVSGGWKQKKKDGQSTGSMVCLQPVGWMGQEENRSQDLPSVEATE
jgi:hypothetical protein